VLLPKSINFGGSAEYDDGNIKLCPRFTICSENWSDVVLLCFSRLSAYWMFPQLVIVYFSKYVRECQYVSLPLPL
jgi:hypothetical protein